MGPTTCLTFLGIEVDTDLLELRLPQEKLQRVKQMVQEWMGHKAACKEKGAWVPLRSLATCSKGSVTRKEICEKDHPGTHQRKGA